MTNHITNTYSVPRSRGDGWFSKCACGWRGERWASRGDAHAEGSAHESVHSFPWQLRYYLDGYEGQGLVAGTPDPRQPDHYGGAIPDYPSLEAAEQAVRQLGGQHAATKLSLRPELVSHMMVHRIVNQHGNEVGWTLRLWNGKDGWVQRNEEQGQP